MHNNLKLLRRYKGLPADVVAGALGIKRSTLSGWENGASAPNAKMLLAVGRYWRIPLDILLGVELMRMPRSEVESIQRAYSQ